MSTPPTASTEQKTLPGASIEDFKTVLEEFTRLKNGNRFSLFQGRENSVRIVGEVDELVIALRKHPDCDKFNEAQVKSVIEEIRQLVQIFLWAEGEERAVSMLSQSVYREEFKNAGKQPESRNAFLEHIRNKIDLVYKNLVTPPMHERAKRLSSCLGAVLEDLDIEIIQQRHSLMEHQTVVSPFLRLKLRYSDKATSLYPFGFAPPWATRPSEGNAFELECDETDIDLLIARLLMAKELLSNALKGSAPASKEITND